MRSPSGAEALDCSQIAPAVFWFGLGVGMAALIMLGSSRGDPTWLLHVGSSNPALSQMQQDLGPIRSPDARGHDGQLYYLIARDPFATGESPKLIAAYDDVGAKYRYRRILFPLLAGGFGQFGPRLTLYSMMVWCAVAMGLVMLATADMAFQLKLKGAAVVIAALHPGVVAPLQLLTADALAIGLSLVGITLSLRGRRHWAVAAFTFATLTKELYWLVPLTVALWLWIRRERRLALATVARPAVPTLLWALWVGEGLSGPRGGVTIFGPPFVGIAEAVVIWIRYEREELPLAAFAVVMMLLAGWMIVSGRNLLLRLALAPWLVVACCAALRMWGKPNNAVRAFALLWPLSVMLFGQVMADRRRSQQ